MTDLPPIANFISNCLIILLLITFAYALYLRFVPDDNYVLTDLPLGSQYNNQKSKNNTLPFF